MGPFRKQQSFFALIEFHTSAEIGGTARDVVEIRASSLKAATQKASRLWPTVTPKSKKNSYGGTATLVGVYTAEQLEEKRGE